METPSDKCTSCMKPRGYILHIKWRDLTAVDREKKEADQVWADAHHCYKLCGMDPCLGV